MNLVDDLSELFVNYYVQRTNKSYGNKFLVNSYFFIFVRQKIQSDRITFLKGVDIYLYQKLNDDQIVFLNEAFEAILNFDSSSSQYEFDSFNSLLGCFPFISNTLSILENIPLNKKTVLLAKKIYIEEFLSYNEINPPKVNKKTLFRIVSSSDFIYEKGVTPEILKRLILGEVKSQVQKYRTLKPFHKVYANVNWSCTDTLKEIMTNYFIEINSFYLRKFYSLDFDFFIKEQKIDEEVPPDLLEKLILDYEVVNFRWCGSELKRRIKEIEKN